MVKKYSSVTSPYTQRGTGDGVVRRSRVRESVRNNDIIRLLYISPKLSMKKVINSPT